ncbi:hypothetical protein [Kocuria turfanensis]|uniref:Uncharacterized protein n=1 Tax=Kocuria turfanensis TaxID=388357 RepID=A0A512IB80_9MICC|nr:hypothetical protein [Kocuria turfanensis]GEO94951.1 hypothetical protein KTU01_10740 [Kocuria turfanensis]
MRILWSAVSLLAVAALAVLLWGVASGTDRVEVVRGGVSVSGAPGPAPTPGTSRTAEVPSSAQPARSGAPGAREEAPGVGTEKPPAPVVPVPPAEQTPVPPAAPAPGPPAQVPLPVQPPLPGDDADGDLDDGPDDDWDDDWDDD